MPVVRSSSQATATIASGLLLDNDPSCKGSARGHGDIDLMLLCKLDELLDFTFSAPLTVPDIACNLDLTVKILNAVREED